MYSITSQFYYEVAQRLCDAIDGESYYSGSIVFTYMDIECRLTTSVIIHRDKVSTSEEESNQILNLVPVWWQFHTCDQEGEIINDFSFNELKTYVV